MKSYGELKADMEAIRQQIVETKKDERADALREVKRLYKGALAEGRKKQ